MWTGLEVCLCIQQRASALETRNIAMQLEKNMEKQLFNIVGAEFWSIFQEPDIALLPFQ